MDVSSDVPRRVSPGFFGKTPSRGDFVTRRLSAPFVNVWDAWLQNVVAASRASLGSKWLDVYLTSPIWRFALAPGVCGDEAHLGVVVPSVDRVGRYFPMAVVLPCGDERAPMQWAAELDEWYLDAENLLLATLADPPLSLEAFDEGLLSLAVSHAAAPGGSRSDWSVGGSAAHLRWHVAVPESHQVRDSLLSVFSGVLSREVGRYGIWWTQGSDRVEPCLLVSSELPEPEAFIAMLDGRWTQRGWQSGRAARGPVPDFDGRDLRFRSAAVTDSGKVRKVNEDSFASRDDLGAWVVADGLGGHQAGDLASRMVTSVLDELAGSASLAERTDRLVRALRVVNGCLQVLARQNDAIMLAGSTVVALLVDGARSTCVWAGDSRLYRLRDGILQQLSRDHSDAEDGVSDHVITRAVGGTEDLQLEIRRADVRAGDRYLLCSDGLYGTVSAEDIAAALSLPESEQACLQLQSTSLTSDARDNLTAVVVHASGPHDRDPGERNDDAVDPMSTTQPRVPR